MSHVTRVRLPMGACPAPAARTPVIAKRGARMLRVLRLAMALAPRRIALQAIPIAVPVRWAIPRATGARRVLKRVGWRKG
jgi:hypothetical protein